MIWAVTQGRRQRAARGHAGMGKQEDFLEEAAWGKEGAHIKQRKLGEGEKGEVLSPGAQSMGTPKATGMKISNIFKQYFLKSMLKKKIMNKISTFS